ncbi:hypothetical protein BOX17_00130 [Halomonas aestuarii]|uniref:Uncharacterized protein n=1 Tax=Halomonas aestuarii TaxID=1897729 RepID=A0A1J0VBS7_9GAMM|nr:hypothetical protein [Halomonas aestuarii]APE29504.1 hypothetical protein BOX17_00130 [Halomonas aestuarii]
MAYLLVMGGLALSVFFSLGWVLVSVARWAGRRLPGGRGASPRQKARRAPNRPKAAAKSAPKASAKATPKAAKESSRATKAKPKAPSEPWRLTRWLARRRSSLPLGLLALLLYGGSRLAEYGMAFRPHEAPGEFHRLVSSLGWASAVLLTVAAVNLLAAWRCRE